MSARNAVTTLGRALGAAVSGRIGVPRPNAGAPALSFLGADRWNGVAWDRAVETPSSHRAWSSFHATCRAERDEGDITMNAWSGTLGARGAVAGTRTPAHSPITARHPGTLHRRARSSAAGEVSDERPNDAGANPVNTRPDGVEYEAALAETVRMVKLLSLASLGATIAGTPLLLELASPDLPANAKMTVSLVVDTFGAFTTGLLQWFVSPYVLKMRMVDDDTVAVTKLTLFARRYEDVFAVSSMREAETTRPLVTWESNGKLHYVEMGRVPKYLYDRLELERFDAQAQAEKYAKENEDKEDEDDDY